MQINILILLLKKFFKQSIFVFAFKIDEKDTIIFSLLSFKLFGRRDYKYFSRVIPFSTLLTKIRIVLMLPMPHIFGGIKKLRSLKSELVIKATVQVIFGESNGLDIDVPVS